jgi:integrase
MKLRAHKPKGSVVFNRTRGTWNFLWCEANKRKSRMLGTLSELPTRAAALRKADEMRREVRLVAERKVPSVRWTVEQYRAEKLPMLRHSTQRIAVLWLNKYVLACWGDRLITDLQPRPVELWLDSLPLAPKTRGHLRELLHRLVDYAMWCGAIPVGTNPISLVTVRGSSKRRKQPRSLTVEEFQKFLPHLQEPFRTIALVCISFGLRISECLALKWSDVDWLNSKLTVERGIVRQWVGNVKTEYSSRKMPVDAELLRVLQTWRMSSEFSSEGDWIFASPSKLGRYPWSYDQVLRTFHGAAGAAGIGKFGTHSMRHSYRSWLDAAGTPIAVQQKLMRHSDIRTTLNIYGDVVTDEMSQAHSKVVRMALN